MDNSDDKIILPGVSGISQRLNGRQRGEHERTRRRADRPARGYIPPLYRPSDLNEENQNDFLEAFYNQNKLILGEDVPLNIIFLTKAYVMNLSQEQQTSIQVWKDKITELTNEQGSHDVRNLNIPGSFIEQLYHIMRLSGLQPREWFLMYKSVEFDESEDNLSKISKMVIACKYQGFDPAVLLKKIVKSWKDGRHMPRQEFIIPLDGQDDYLRFSNHESLIDDMTFILVIFLNRGAVISKIANKSSREFAAVLRMLVAKYMIRANDDQDRRRRATAIGPEIVTLPRIAACFAQSTTNLYHRGFGRAIANFNFFNERGDFPYALFSPMFSSVVRKSYTLNEVRYNIHPQLVLIAILIDNVLHIRDRVTLLDQIWTYYLASYNSSVLIDSARIEQCDLYEITNDGLFTDSLINIRQACIEKIRELRTHERINDFITEMNTI